MVMATRKLTLRFFIVFSSVLGVICEWEEPEIPPTEDVEKWCNSVPHPEACKFFMSKKSLKPRNEFEFRKMAVELALDRAQDAQKHAWGLGQRCDGHKERAAWVDCVRLYDHTIILLNQTLQGLTTPHATNSSSSCTDFDAQTWFSSALTNLDTCKVGSDDMNVTQFLWPHFQFNVSDLVSNVLAINQGLLMRQDNYTTNTSALHDDDEEYPGWVTHEDRRLLVSHRKLAASKAMFVVAKDHTGHFKTIQAAINAASRSRLKRKIIYVKKGIYRENINVNPYNNDIMLVGQGMRNTIVTASRSVRAGYTTYNSATAGIDGLRFIARDITFRNTAGPEKGQAVALRSSSDLSVFYKCSFIGYQDTLFVHSQRQFYKMCYIFGTIDIIFGNAAVVFQSCIINVRKPIWGQANVVTAQGRADPNQNTGIVIHSSRITANRDLLPRIGSVATYLGRPWQKYSRTVIMKSFLDRLVHPVGWLEWNGNRYVNTLYYAEYKNFGPGSNVGRRVRWGGFHSINNPNAVSKFTVGSFIAGRAWLPATGVPFSAGL